MIHENPKGGFHRSENTTELGLIPATKKLLEKALLMKNPRLDHVLLNPSAGHTLRVVR